MKRLFNNTVFSSIDALVLVALNLLATPILLKHLGVPEYGAFVFLSMFSTYGILSVFGLGMEGAILNYVARYEASGAEAKIRNSLAVSLLYYAIMGLGVGILLYGFSGFIISRFIDDTGVLNTTQLLLSVKIVAVNVLVQFLTFPMIAVLQGLRRFVMTKSLNTVLMVLQYTLLILVTVLYHRLDIAFMVILGITILRLVVLAYMIAVRVPHFRRMRFGFDFGIVKSLFTYSSILFVSRLIGIVFNQMDKFLIWFYLAISSLAVYDVVIRPANLIRLLIGILNAAVIPEVARLHEQGETAGIRSLYIDLVRYAYLIIMPALVVLFVHAETLLHLWVGSDLAGHYHLALIMLAVYVIAPIVSMASTFAVGMELVKKTIWISVVASVINVVLSLGLIRSLGLTGLLVATLTAEIFMLFPYLYMMRRYLALDPDRLMRPLFLIGATSLPFAAANYWLRDVADSSIIAWAASVLVLTAAHFAVHFRFLLNAGEQAYVLSKLGLRKTRLIPGAY